MVQLDVGKGDYRPQLKKIHKSTEPHIILSVEPQRIIDVFNQTNMLQMLDDEYLRCFVISFDTHTIDLTRGADFFMISFSII